MTKADVLTALQAISEEIEAIENLFADNGQMPARQVERGQEMFKALKEKIEPEYKRMATIKGQATLSSVEENFYMPTVNRVWVEISPVRWNSSPSKEWLEKLDNARAEARYFIDQLKED